MHYYKFNIGNYYRKTNYLSHMEDLAYRRLLDSYYLNETPFPDDIKQIARKINMRDYRQEVENVLSDFFVLIDGFWVHEQVEEKICEYKSLADVARENGKKGGRPRKKTQEKPSGLNLETQSDASGNPEESESKANHKPITINQEPITKDKDKPAAFNFKNSLIENGVEQEVAEAWLAIRKKKKATNSQFAFNKLKAQIEKAGVSFNEAIDYAAERDWKGFDAEWYLSSNPTLDLPYDEILSAFNQCSNLTDCVMITGKRKSLISESWTQSVNHQNIKFWQSYFNYVSNNASSFEEWQLNFDYLININYMIKIIERARAVA